MKKHSKILSTGVALAAGILMAQPAMAQSSVTVYGILDVFIQQGKGNATSTTLESGGLNGSRLGFKGTEDLGGGLKALFQIEHGLNVDTGTVGQGGVMWGRQAFVGLGGGFGTLTMGRQYTPHFQLADSHDPFDTGAGSAFNSGVVTAPSRVNNSVQYEAPTFGGFKATFMQTAGEGNVGAKLSNALLQFTQGPVSVSASYAQSDTPETTKYFMVAGNYDFGVAKLHAGLQKIKNATGAVGAQDDRKEFWAGIKLPVGQVGQVALAYYDGKTDGVAGSKASQWNAGYTHNLSLRTSIYGVYSVISNGGQVAFTPYAATGGGVAVSNGVDPHVLQVGIRHRF